LEDLLGVAVPGKRFVTRYGVYHIHLDCAGDRQGSAETVLPIKQLIEVRYTRAVVDMCMHIRSGFVAIPADSNRTLAFCSSAESLKTPDWIEVIGANDFRLCLNLCGSLRACRRKSEAFAVVETLSASCFLGELKS
jgi:hypothetical protein